MTGTKNIAVTFLIVALGLHSPGRGAVTVTASRQYVDNKVEALRTNLLERIDNSSPGNYTAVSNAAMNALSMADSTNVVGSIVTNTVHTWRKITQSEWDMRGNPVYEGNNTWRADFERDSGDIGPAYANGPEDATLLRFRDNEIDVSYERCVYNALGLARLSDMPDATLTPVYSDTPTFSEWTFSIPGDYSVTEAYDTTTEPGDPFWQYILYHEGTGIGGTGFPDRMTEIDWGDYVEGLISTRTRTDVIGYTLGSQTDKVLASTNLQTGVSATTVTNMVCDIVTNEVDEWSFKTDFPSFNPSEWRLEFLTNEYEFGWFLKNLKDEGNSSLKPGLGEDVQQVVFEPNEWVYGAPSYSLVATRITRNALGLARYKDVPAIVSNTVTKGYVENLGIEVGVDTNRHALFVIDLNPGEARIWNGIELKATTNNFAVTESGEGMLFYCPTIINGVKGELGPYNVGTNDWCRLFVLSKRADSDIRRWTAISNTADLLGYAPLSLAVLVSQDKLRRVADKDWLYEGNKELIWSFVRISDEPETDQDGRQCWRPIMPVKWYDELPDWANKSPESFDSEGIAQYVAPWQEAIEGADTSYQRFDVATNVNQSVQYVTNALGGVLSVEIPASGSTKDWVMYCLFGSETAIRLPSATWWLADAAHTNAIPANQPTVLYFTQVTDGIYMMSRQELTTISIQE